MKQLDPEIQKSLNFFAKLKGKGSYWNKRVRKMKIRRLFK